MGFKEDGFCVVAANTIVTENVESENLIGIKSEIKCINNHINI